jgi:hypothetical protein
MPSNFFCQSLPTKHNISIAIHSSLPVGIVTLFKNPNVPLHAKRYCGTKRYKSGFAASHESWIQGASANRMLLADPRN